MAIPFAAYAGILSFISGLFSSSANAEEGDNSNSQTIALLKAPININPNPSIGGSEVVIVGDALLPDTSPNGGLSENFKDGPISDQISVYVVHEGDTLSTISKMFGVSVNTIRWNNDITGSVIKPGQVLTILPVSGVRHTVKKGDTLQSIAKLYKGDIEDIKKYNNITENTVLSIGDVVIVPDGEISTQSSGSSGVSRVQLVSSGANYDGYYIRPASGKKTQGIHGHNGIDIGGSIGSPIIAAASGKVIISRVGGWNGGYGNYIVIQHSNGTQTLYAHTSQNLVFEGQTVDQGQLIAYIGRTGKATGPHLHFEVRGARNPF